MNSSNTKECDRIRPMLVNDDVIEDDVMEEVEEEDKEIIEGEGGAAEGGDEEEIEESTTKVTRGPTVPSKWEKERHEVTHVPFRSWCSVCVAGRGVKAPHKLRKRGEDELPRFSMDYGFLGQQGQDTAVLFVMKEIGTGMTMAMIVPKKGLSDDWIPRRISGFVRTFGYKKIIIRSDNEPAIVALRKAVATLCEEQVLEEDAIKGESQTNGLAEVGIRIIEGIVRTLKIDVEEKLKYQIDNRSVILAWLVEHAAMTYNRCSMMKDGRTPWQRLYQKQASLPLVPFAEQVLYKQLRATGDLKNSLAARFKYGLYVGSRPKSGEHFVATEEGVIRCRDVRRLSEERRYDVDKVKNIKGTPWAPLDGTTLLEVPTHIQTERPRIEEDQEYVPEINVKRMMIRKEDVEKYGATKNCGGCQAVEEGRGRRVNHTQECRNRIEEEMKQDPNDAMRIERSKRRIDEEIGREVERRLKFEAKKVDASKSKASSSSLSQDASPSSIAAPPPPPAAASSPAPAAVASTPVLNAPSVDDDLMTGDAGGPAKKRRMQILTYEEEMKVMLSVGEDAVLPNQWRSKYYDDITGEPLDEEAVRIAEEEEIEFMRKSRLYTKVLRSSIEGQKVIPIRWVRVNKGTKEKPNVRCRVVAKEIKTYDDDSLFAATPPLESLKVLLAMAASHRWALKHIDVKRAYFHAKALREIYVEIDDKDKEEEEGDVVGRLNYAMYGTRDAASSWEACYTQVLVSAGFAQGKFTPCVFRRDDVVVTVHGDDFTMTGQGEGLMRTEEEIRRSFDVKVQDLDPADVGAQMIVLNRRIVVEENGYAYEPDGKHTNKVLAALGLDAPGTKGSTVTGAKAPLDEEDLKGRKLDNNRSSWFRSVAATLNYMSLDRPDLGFAVKEVCRSMSSPSEFDVQKLKKIGRYLVEFGNTRSVFE